MNSKEIRDIKYNEKRKSINLNTAEIGTKVIDYNSTYYGEPIVWIIAAKNHSGYPVNSVTLIADKLLCIKPLDAREPNNSDSDKRGWGNSAYDVSNISTWLNSSGSNWYSKKHNADEPPTSDKVKNNPYNNEAGFMTNISSSFKNSLLSTDIKTAKLKRDGGGYSNITTKFFLPSKTEVGLGAENGIDEGTVIELFNNGNRKAYPTDKSVSNSAFKDSNLNASKNWKWYLRSADTNYGCRNIIVQADGNIGWNDAQEGDLGIRPICNVKNDSNFFYKAGKGTEITRAICNKEIIWSKGTVPGSNILIAGNTQAGFYGEVASSEFISGDDLARELGITAGVSQYSNEPWLKFSYMGKIEFIAKKPFRYDIMWNDINNANAVFGNRTINIKGKTYKVRLAKGKTEGKQNDTNSYAGSINWGSEWNRLMLPIHEKAPSNWHNSHKGNVEPNIENWGVNYTDDDLIMDYTSGKGPMTWCQEAYYSECLVRTNAGSYNHSSDWKDSRAGWRPVLELVY